MNDIKTVIFDLDNTLFGYDKSDKAGKKAVAAYMKQRFGMEEEESLALLQKKWDEQNALMNPQNSAVHSRLIRYQMVVDELKKPLFPHVQSMCTAYWNAFYDAMVPEDGITEVLRSLKLYGVEIAIGTNMTTWVQYEKIRRLNLGAYVDRIITSEEAEAEKPSPAFYDFLLRYLGRTKEECLFVGDSIRIDYEGAANYGIPSVWYAASVTRKKKEEDPNHPYPAERINSYQECIEKEGLRLGQYFFSF